MTPNISIIVAMAKNRAIGINNTLLCHISNDLKHFKKVTSGHCVVMGQRTFKSLPNGALPNRRNIVLTDCYETAPKGTEIATSLKHVFELVKDEEEVFIIGGGSVYEQMLPYANKLYITYMDKSFEADTFFPPFNLDDWELIELEVIDDDPSVDFSYRFETYERETE